MSSLRHLEVSCKSFNLLLSISAVFFSFEESDAYEIDEGAGPMQLCVVLTSGVLGRAVTLSLNSAQDTDDETLNGTMMLCEVRNMIAMCYKCSRQ